MISSSGPVRNRALDGAKSTCEGHSLCTGALPALFCDDYGFDNPLAVALPVQDPLVEAASSNTEKSAHGDVAAESTY